MAHMGAIFFFVFVFALYTWCVCVCVWVWQYLSASCWIFLFGLNFFQSSHRCDFCHLISFTPKQAPVTVVFESVFRIPIFNLVDKAHCCSICLPNNYFCHMHKSCRSSFSFSRSFILLTFFPSKFVYWISRNILKTETIRFVLLFPVSADL